jgi:hypothetical protein
VSHGAKVGAPFLKVTQHAPVELALVSLFFKHGFQSFLSEIINAAALTDY